MEANTMYFYRKDGNGNCIQYWEKLHLDRNSLNEMDADMLI